MPPLSPVSMAPPLWAPVLSPERVELASVTVPVPPLSPLSMAPPSPPAESPEKDEPLTSSVPVPPPSPLSMAPPSMLTPLSVKAESGDAKGAGAGRVPVVDGTTPFS